MKVHDRIYSVEGESFSGQEDLFTRVQELLADDITQLHFQVESRGAVREVILSLKIPTAAVGDPTL